MFLAKFRDRVFRTKRRKFPERPIRPKSTLVVGQKGFGYIHTSSVSQRRKKRKRSNGCDTLVTGPPSTCVILCLRKTERNLRVLVHFDAGAYAFSDVIEIVSLFTTTKNYN